MWWIILAVIVVLLGLAYFIKSFFFGRETITVDLSGEEPQTQFHPALPPVPPVRRPRHAAPEAPTEVIRRTW